MKKGLAVFSSPRKNGFSSTLHGAFLEELRSFSVARVHVYDLDIHPCIACGKCRDEFICPIKDDMEIIYRMMDECSFISISTPLFFSAPPAPFKALIDRCQPFWERRRREGTRTAHKKSFLIAVGGGEYSLMFEPLKHIIRHFLHSCGFESHADEWIFSNATDHRTISDDELHRAALAGSEFARRIKENL